MEYTFVDDPNRFNLFRKAYSLALGGDFNKALMIYEDMLFVHWKDRNSWILHLEQSGILKHLAQKSQKTCIYFAYMLGALGCVSEDMRLSRLSACVFFDLARVLGKVSYYKKGLVKANQALSAPLPDPSDTGSQLLVKRLKSFDNNWLERYINIAEAKILESKATPVTECKPEVWDSMVSPEPEPLKDERKELRSFWLGLDVNTKTDFMKVSIVELLRFAHGVNGGQGQHALEKVLSSARKDRKWIFWMCRSSCSKKFSSADQCKTHFEQQHAVDFIPSCEKHVVKRIGKEWARKISAGTWEPVDIVAAVEMIKNRLSDVKAFTFKNGWSKEWPLAADEERSKVLKDIKLLLESFSTHKVLSYSIRDCVMRFPVKHLTKLEVSEQSLVDSRLRETPQSLCFLECQELIEIRDFLESIKCKRNDVTNMVCVAVDNILGRTQVKEKIDFDTHFLFLLLDKRLLKSKSSNAPVDNDETINVFDPSVHYAKAPAHGDDIISWLLDYSSVDNIFPKPIREHNLDIWMAVLRAVQFTCRTLGTKYAKKAQILDYDKALTLAKNLCMKECDRRRELQEDQWNRYASLLCNRCELMVPGNMPTAKLFLCAVRDVLEGASHPTFDYPNLEDCLNVICEHKILSDDKVLKSIDHLKSEVTHKVLLIDVKILLIDNSRISLINNLTKLSVFDHRSYILQVLKPFLLKKIEKMESKAKLDAAVADLLPKEKTSQSKKKKKKKSDKGTLTSVCSPLDTTVQHEPSVNVEQEGTSPSLETLQQDFVEPEDIPASERCQLEISSNIGNREESPKVDNDIKNMPGEDSSSEHLESAHVEAAARYNSALDTTLKAILNIKVFKDYLMRNRQPFHDDLENQVPCAVQDLFSAILSEEIKNEGVYSFRLRELHDSLEVVHFMWGSAAEVLVGILEFWHCWKNPERESLVTRLFTLEENESTVCRECSRKPNYPEQTSYGIVMAAYSIRELKRAFGDVKFVNILKVIRMEDEMLCDIRTGGCGKTNFVNHSIGRCPPIFIIVLEWEKSETEGDIIETIKALEWEIDISRLYEGLEQNTNYRLVSMVGCGEEEEEHVCLAYEKMRWVNLRRESLKGEVVGNWKSVIRFCGERKVRPQILFYEAAQYRINSNSIDV